MAAKPLIIRLSIKEGLKQPSVIHGLSDVLVYPTDNRDGTFTITGGGIVVLNAVKGGQSAMAITGGGVVVLSASKGGRVVVSVTGGGVVQLVNAKNGQVISTVTGGGVITVNVTSNRDAVFNVTGGGAMTFQMEQPGDLIEIEFDEGGAGPVAKRRAGRTEFDDWTIMMDDEAILELYLLRKTR